MNSDAIQKQQFQERLKRVKDGGANTSSQMYAGTVEPKRKNKRYEVREAHQTVEKKPRTLLFLPIYLATGLIIGAGSVVIARYLRFKLEVGTLTGINADLWMAGDIILALSIAIILRVIFRFKSKLHGVAKFVGVVAAVLLMHNAVYIVPGPFAKVFSAKWVNQIMRAAPENSILIAGYAYNFEFQKIAGRTPVNRQR